jgi:hypothetical protein
VWIRIAICDFRIVILDFADPPVREPGGEFEIFDLRLAILDFQSPLMSSKGVV